MTFKTGSIVFYAIPHRMSSLHIKKDCLCMVKCITKSMWVGQLNDYELPYHTILYLYYYITTYYAIVHCSCAGNQLHWIFLATGFWSYRTNNFNILSTFYQHFSTVGCMQESWDTQLQENRHTQCYSGLLTRVNIIFSDKFNIVWPNFFYGY